MIDITMIIDEVSVTDLTVVVIIMLNEMFLQSAPR